MALYAVYASRKGSSARQVDEVEAQSAAAAIRQYKKWEQVSGNVSITGTRFKATKVKRNPKRSNPKSVYDDAGKLLGKFKRKVAPLIARAVGGTVGKPKKNPAKPKSGKVYRSLASAQKAHERLMSQGYYDAGVVATGDGRYRVLFKEKNPSGVIHKRFRSRQAAEQYALTHGAKAYSITKMRGR